MSVAHARLDFAFLASVAVLDEESNTYRAVGVGLRSFAASTWPAEAMPCLVMGFRVPSGVVEFEAEIIGVDEVGEQFLHLGMPTAVGPVPVGSAVDVRPDPIPLELTAREPGVVDIQVWIDEVQVASLPLHFVDG